MDEQAARPAHTDRQSADEPLAGAPPAAKELRITLTRSRIRAIGVIAAGALVLGILVWPAANGRPGPALGADPAAIEHTISVSGTGLISVKPDVADITIGVSADRSSAKDARDAAATAMNAVVGAIKKDGVADDDIKTVNISLEPVYEYNNGNSTPRLVAQRFTNTVRVTVRNLTSVPAVVDDSVSAGATVVSGIAFRLDNPKPVQAQARQAAMDDARAKADALAKAAGVSIKGVATVSETGYTQPSYYAADKLAAAGSAATPVQSGTTDVSVQVSVTYVIG